MIVDVIQAEAQRRSVRDARVSAWGTVDDAAVALFDPERREYGPAQVLRGASAVVHFEGRLALFEGAPRLTAYVVLGRGPQVIAGQLVTARAGTLEVVMEAWDDLGREESASEPVRAKAAEQPAPAPETAKTLADAARLLESMPEPFHTDDVRGDPEPGELLDHPSFGIVELESEGDGGRVKIKLPNGSRRDIMLEVFEVVEREPLRGKRCFALRPRRR